MTTEKEVLIIDGRRTPFGKYGGALKLVPSIDLGAFIIRRLLEVTNMRPSMVDEVYYGTCEPMETGTAIGVPARQAIIKAGLPPHTPSITLDSACCSSMDAVNFGYRDIRFGLAETVLAVGAENMGRQVYYFAPEFRWGPHRRDLTLIDAVYRGGKYPLQGAKPLAQDAGEVALEYGVTREEQDEWAYLSQKRYAEAWERGRFANEMTSLVLEYDSETVILDRDEQARPDATMEQLRQLKPVNNSPTVTAGNAPGINAGATALLLMEADKATQENIPALARIVHTKRIATEPRLLAVAPGVAIQQILEETGISLKDLKLIEINEAFAAVPLVSLRILAQNDAGLLKDLKERTNVNGGAVAIGHPVGASGARIILTLAKELQRRGGGYGVAAICGGLAQGSAVLIKAI